jgi:hypothetical protein
MEREMCNYLDWELTVDNTILANFIVSKQAVKAAATTSAMPLPEPKSSTSPIPNFSHQQHQSLTLPLKPTHAAGSEKVST